MRTPKIIFAVNPVSNVRVRIDGGGFLVESKRNPGTWHIVSKDGACDCRGFEFHGTCWHVKYLTRLGMIEEEDNDDTSVASVAGLYSGNNRNDS